MQPNPESKGEPPPDRDGGHSADDESSPPYWFGRGRPRYMGNRYDRCLFD